MDDRSTDRQEPDEETILIRREPIELCQLLKIGNLVQSGGEAKLVISRGLVRVNGELETRKRRKIRYGDKVGFGDRILRVGPAGS